MNRTILFRGKREDNGEWETGSLVIIRGGCSDVQVFIADKMTGYHTPVIPDTIGQYTGLKDMNGTEIYEGDIVSFEDSDGGYEYQDTVFNSGAVAYGDLGFYFTNRQSVEMDDFYIKNGQCEDIEIIGNIHDNPELLGGDDT